MLGTTGDLWIQSWGGSAWDVNFATSKAGAVRPYIAKNTGPTNTWEIELAAYHGYTHNADSTDPISIKASQVTDIDSIYYPRTNPSGYITSSGTNLISGDNTFYGDQYIFSGADIIISGGTFNSNIRPRVNGTGVLLSGEAAQVDLSTTVRTTGNQSITGQKTFNSQVTINSQLIVDQQISLRAKSTLVTPTQIPVFTSNPDSVTGLILTRTPEQLRSDIGAINGTDVVYTTGNQNISGEKTFFANNYIFSGANVLFDNASELDISGGLNFFGNKAVFQGTDNTNFLIRGGNAFINVNGIATNTNSTLEVYNSGNYPNQLKINNPDTGIISSAILNLSAPGNSVNLYANPNNRGYACGFEGSQFTEYYFINNNTTRLLIKNDGKVLIGLTNPIANGAKLQLDGGITFPVVQNSSANLNTLDDYEEGTWNPILEGESTNGTFVYGGGINRTGQYTKIGNTVFIRGRFWATSASVAAAGNLRLGGLPYNAHSAIDGQSVVNIPFWANLKTPVFNLYGLTQVSSNKINLFKVTGAVLSSNGDRLTYSDITGVGNTGVQLCFAGTYMTNT